MPAEAVMDTATLKLRVDAGLHRDAEAIYAAAGITLDDAVRQLLLRTVEQQAVPLSLLRLNSETTEAIAAARRGEFAGHGSIDDLFAELDADD